MHDTTAQKRKDKISLIKMLSYASMCFQIYLGYLLYRQFYFMYMVLYKKQMNAGVIFLLNDPTHSGGEI